MMTIKRYLIGRRKQTDIDISIDQKFISRHHAELIQGNDGTYLLIDRCSANGTYVWEKERWKRIRQKVVKQNTLLALGKYETDVHSLLSKSR